MGLVKNLQFFILNLVCWLGCLSYLVLAQDMNGVTGFLNIPDVAITCVGNLAVFVTCLIRGRLDLEIGARDVLDILVSSKLKTINGIKKGNGLTTCTEGRQTASTGGVRLHKMGEFFTRLRHRLGINIPCIRGNEDLQTVSAEGGGLHTFSADEGRLQTASTVEIVLQTASTEGEGEGLHTASDQIGSVHNASVVMLSNGKPNWSIREFIKSNAPIVDSILLQYIPLQDAINDSEEVPIEMCGCNFCNCIVFWTMEELTIMLALRIPGTLKLLSSSLCLLPCLTCLTNGCHGCNGDNLLTVEGPLPLEQSDEGHRVRVCKSKVVSEILDDIGARSITAKEHICICIPMHGASSDVWTELLVRTLRSKDAAGRGVRVMASEALEGYLAGGRVGSTESVEYNIVSFVLPRLTEVVIALALTFWFRVDGFSSSLAARRTVADYLVDSKGSGFAANSFLTKAVVKSDFNNTQVCQVLTFRGDLLGIITLSFIVASVNLICSIGWTVLIAYKPHISPLPDMPRLFVIVAAVSIALCMDAALVLFRPTFISRIRRFSSYFVFIFSVIAFLFLLLFLLAIFKSKHQFLFILYPFAFYVFTIVWPFLNSKEKIFLWVVILQIVGLLCLITGLPIRDGFSWRLTYGVLQILVWLKWTSGSYILSKNNSLEFFGKSPHGWGILTYSSAFFLNAVLAGVRCKWGAWPWSAHQE